MTPKKSNALKPPTAPDEGWRGWEAGALDREIDQFFNWRFYCEAEDRSLNHLGELLDGRTKAKAKRTKRRRPSK